MSKTHQAYTLQFKQDALARAAALGSCDRAGIELQVSPQLLYKWRAQQKKGQLRASLGADKAVAAPAQKSRGSVYPDSLRDEAVRRYRAGEPVPQINLSLGIQNPTAVYTWAKARGRNGKSTSHTSPSTPAAAPAPPLRYCPCCGFRIDALIKAVNAMTAINSLNNHHG